MHDFRFALVMENEVGESYVTEKIVIAFVAGAIPIYHGAATDDARLHALCLLAGN